MLIGLEAGDARVTAVSVDPNGATLARTTVVGTDLAPAARAAILELRGASGAPATVGVTAFSPEAVAALPAAIGRDGLAVRPGVVSSGGAAAVAEHWVGAASGKRDAVYFGIAEHAIGGVIRNGALLEGSRGRAASVAWLALNPVEREDYRKVGCLEAEVAAAGIVRRLVWRIKAGDRSQVQDAVGDNLGAITVDQVLGAARNGDGVSISVVRDTAKYLGMAAANLVIVADPEVLVLGGIMATAADLLFDAVRAEVTRRLPKPMMDELTIAPAALGADAPAIGAARLAAAAVQ